MSFPSLHFQNQFVYYPFLLRVAAFLLSISFDWPESIKDEAVSFDWLESTEAVPFDWLESIEVVSFDWLESIKDEAISFDWLESIKDEAISFDWLEAIEDEAGFLWLTSNWWSHWFRFLTSCFKLNFFTVVFTFGGSFFQFVFLFSSVDFSPSTWWGTSWK